MPIALFRAAICAASSPKARVRSGAMNRDKPRPHEHTSLRDYPYVVVRFRCHVCERGGDSRLALLAWKFGPGMLIGGLLRKFIGGCPWDPHNPARKPQKYGHRCGAYIPDLVGNRPPD